MVKVNNNIDLQFLCYGNATVDAYLGWFYLVFFLINLLLKSLANLVSTGITERRNPKVLNLTIPEPRIQSKAYNSPVRLENSRVKEIFHDEQIWKKWLFLCS